MQLFSLKFIFVQIINHVWTKVDPSLCLCLDLSFIFIFIQVSHGLYLVLRKFPKGSHTQCEFL